jgi:hypothetical protein
MSSTELSQTSFASANRRTAKHVKMSSKLATYGAAATGAAAVLGGASVAEAGIVYSGAKSITWTEATPFVLDFGDTSLNDSLAPGGFVNQFTFKLSVLDPYYYGSAGSWTRVDGLSGANSPKRLVGTGTGVTLLSAGKIVGPSNYNPDQFESSIQGKFGNNLPNVNGYIGVKFNSNTTPLYGWIQYQGTYDPTTETMTSYSVLGWAYDDTGAAIAAGAVPEPTGLGLLALGALTGASRWRRRREEQSAA